MNIYSDEVDATYVLDEIIDKHSEKWVDLRPYMIEHPFKVSIYCKCAEVLELFRLHHLRHLLVVNPNNGELDGIITRKDLFTYLNS